ncbi:MAG: phenylalanine--tRNA ligase subunit beta [Tannerella sp.]|jgi:phenylalanyl-tRNA synthetase beta chain|nr:phenylalanine--tRNA ligase subunit beta [Tannerella sp.]
MKISYHWLKEYLPLELRPDEVAAALTSTGLETGSVEEVQLVRGGLKGLVIGEVLTCTAHPDSDHLHLTTVDVGGGEPLCIVCGAPNVEAGQKVVVAPVGTTLYGSDGGTLTLKRSKIRGRESFGMICAEDEIGLGTDHSGIIVLPADAKVGMPAAQYYGIESDYVLEVDITPNRVDATSHYGVGRDLAAWLTQAGRPAALQRPSVEAFRVDRPAPAIAVEVANRDACLRYSGLTVRGVTVKESPAWLKNRLQAIGLRPINNVVDITNFILHELGQPLHAFDAARIRGGRVVVRTLPEGTKFVTLDGVERTLAGEDLMICDAEEPMCIAGVFGGLDSGVTEQTRDVFLESACFHPAWVRRTARRFGLNTDASFRFERGLDPNQTVYVLKRAALLVNELAGGEITGDIRDVYPEEVKPYPVQLTYRRMNALVGKEIPVETVKRILASLEVEIVAETEEGLSLRVPVYRMDVRREVDVIEEILRIYGYNRVEVGEQLRSTLSYRTPTDRNYQLETLVAEQLCGAGFHEIMNNSLTRLAYYDTLETCPAARAVQLLNPLSADLNAMRQTLLFGGLQSIAYNINHKNRNLRFFESGNCYAFHAEEQRPDEALSGYCEEYRLGLWMCGRSVENSWTQANRDASVYELKACVQHILRRLGIDLRKVSGNMISDDIYASGLRLKAASGRLLGTLGVVDRKLLKGMDIGQEVYYAELSWDALRKEIRNAGVVCSEIAKYPEVKRDLALLLDREILFQSVEKSAFESERKLLKRVELFDVYEGSHLPPDKKSYAVSFYLQDENRTLTDPQIDRIMQKIRTGLEQKLGAQLR